MIAGLNDLDDSVEEAKCSINELHGLYDQTRLLAQTSNREIIDMKRSIEIMDQRTLVMATHVADLKTTLSRIYESARESRIAKQIGGNDMIRGGNY